MQIINAYYNNMTNLADPLANKSNKKAKTVMGMFVSRRYDTKFP